MASSVISKCKAAAQRLYLKLLIKAKDDLRWQLDHDEICLASYDRQSAGLMDEIITTTNQLKELENESNNKEQGCASCDGRTIRAGHAIYRKS